MFAPAAHAGASKEPEGPSHTNLLVYLLLATFTATQLLPLLLPGLCPGGCSPLALRLSAPTPWQVRHRIASHPTPSNPTRIPFHTGRCRSALIGISLCAQSMMNADSRFRPCLCLLNLLSGCFTPCLPWPQVASSAFVAAGWQQLAQAVFLVALFGRMVERSLGQPLLWTIFAASGAGELRKSAFN